MFQRYLYFLFPCALLLGFNFQTDELLINGRFNGDPSHLGWEQTGGGNLSRTAGGKSGGYLCLNASGATTAPAVRQSVPGLKPGRRYVISGYYRPGEYAAARGSHPGTPAFTLTLDGRTLQTFPLPAERAEWTPFEYTFTATARTQIIGLSGEVNSTQGDVDLDDLSLRPEPAGWYRLKEQYERG